MHVIAKMLKCEDEVFLTKTVPIQKQSDSSDYGFYYRITVQMLIAA